MRAGCVVSCAVAALLSGGVGMATAADAASAPAAGSAAIVSAGAAGSAPVADAAGAAAPVDEIVVTAQRRNESIEKVPLTIQAFTGKTLSQLNVTTLDDLLKYTSNVTYGNNGPGQGNIFIRGLSAGFAGNQSSATAGNFPNVAVYLDDQSFQFPSRNVDIYVVDMNRVEVLEGPQGTLFGGGAEAGAVRYITGPHIGESCEDRAHLYRRRTLLTQLLLRLERDKVLSEVSMNAILREARSLNGEHADNPANLDALLFLEEVEGALKDARAQAASPPSGA